MGAGTANHAQVILVLQFAQPFGIAVDERDFVILSDQIFRQGSAYLTCAKNADLPRVLIA